MPKVWIVEDNDTIRECLIMFLSMEGFQVEAFSEGRVALQNALENPTKIWPELVLLDLYTDAMSPFHFVQKLSALASQLRKRSPKICVVSAASDIEDISGLLNADSFFQKPFDIPALIHYAKQTCAQAVPSWQH
jgi:DNA-binding response OmpR family regulator